MLALLRSRSWFGLLLAYFAAHVVLRTQVGHPPDASSTGSFLYDWLTQSILGLAGSDPWVLSLISPVCLFLTFVCIFQTVRRFGRMDWAWATTLSLFFIPQIVWVGQHDDGVVDLATLMAAANLWAFTWMLDQRNFVSFGLFGAVIGLSALTSHSALFVSVTLVLAALTHRQGQKLLADWRVFVAALVAVMWSAPAWVGVLKTYQTIHTGVTDLPAIAFWANTGALVEILQATLGFAGFIFVGIGLLFHVGLGALPRVEPQYLHLRQILGRQLALGFILFLIWRSQAPDAALTFASLRPFLILLVPLSGLYLAPLMSVQVRNNIARTAMAVAVLILFASPTQYAQSTGGVTAWYLELRASEGARTPLL